jgi:hypothetical protein
LELGGYAYEFVRATATAALTLAQMLQGDIGLSDPLADRLNRLEEQLDALNENLRNFVNVLDSLPSERD